MKWREALSLVARNIERRAAHYASPMPGGPSDDYTRGERYGRRSAYETMRDELLYAASLPPAEGVAYLRKLGGVA